MKRHRMLAKIVFRNLSREDRKDYPTWLKGFSRF